MPKMQSKLNELSNTLRNLTVYTSNIIMLTMAFSTVRNSWLTLNHHTKQSPFVASALITNQALPSIELGSLVSYLNLSCFMQCTITQRLSTKVYGPMHYDMQAISTISFLEQASSSLSTGIVYILTSTS